MSVLASERELRRIWNGNKANAPIWAGGQSNSLESGILTPRPDLDELRSKLLRDLIKDQPKQCTTKGSCNNNLNKIPENTV